MKGEVEEPGIPHSCHPHRVCIEEGGKVIAHKDFPREVPIVQVPINDDLPGSRNYPQLIIARLLSENRRKQKRNKENKKGYPLIINFNHLLFLFGVSPHPVNKHIGGALHLIYWPTSSKG